MTPTGRLDDGTLVLQRRLRAPIDDVWASIAESDRLSRWFGTWTGDPATGSVMVTMNAEAEEPAPVEYHILACEPPRLLSVRATDTFGTWWLTAELAQNGPVTDLVLRQHEIDLDTLAETGPGWEWYLDRLVAAVEEQSPPTLEDFDTTYMAMVPAYGALRPPS